MGRSRKCRKTRPKVRQASFKSILIPSYNPPPLGSALLKRPFATCSCEMQQDSDQTMTSLPTCHSITSPELLVKMCEETSSGMKYQSH
eukprot:1693479-Amphidinium_carterae.1